MGGLSLIPSGLVSMSLKIIIFCQLVQISAIVSEKPEIDCTGENDITLGQASGTTVGGLCCYPSSACSVDKVVDFCYSTFVSTEFASFSTGFLNKNEVEFADNQAEHTLACWLFFSFIVSPNFLVFLLVNFSMRGDTIKYQKMLAALTVYLSANNLYFSGFHVKHLYLD